MFVYTPKGNVWGDDAFSYIADDVVNGDQHSVTAAVIISLRFMLLVDSIAAGITSSNSRGSSNKVGYHKTLRDVLQATDYSVDIVDSKNDGYSVSNFDTDHDGHPGWSTFDMIISASYIENQGPKFP
jgi:hypothetical protein